VFETRKEGELILIFAKKKKKLSKNVKIGSVLCPPKTTKKEYFREHFRASEFKHALFSKCSYYHTTTSSIARRA
jgi:hypothetical protein